MEKKLTEYDKKMIIYTRKFLDDAKRCLDLSDEQKVEIFQCMEWLDSLRK